MARRRGNPKLQEQRNSDTGRANAERVRLADMEAAKLYLLLLKAARTDGAESLGEQADWLNKHGHKTRGGNLWSPRTVKRHRDRMRSRKAAVLAYVKYSLADTDPDGV